MSGSPRCGGDSGKTGIDANGLVADAGALGGPGGKIGVAEAGSETGAIEGGIIDNPGTVNNGEPNGSSGRRPNVFIA